MNAPATWPGLAESLLADLTKDQSDWAFYRIGTDGSASRISACSANTEPPFCTAHGDKAELAILLSSFASWGSDYLLVIYKQGSFFEFWIDNVPPV